MAITPSILPPVDPDAPGLPGQSPLGRYEVRRVLGRGAMGEVLLCRDARIGRDVAKKVMVEQHHGDRQARARFLREARVQGQLEHPAIVPVYDLGVDETGADYFTMKCLRGETLAEILKALAPSWARSTRCAACSRPSRRRAWRSTSPTRAACCTAISSPPT
jgi:serine/threonine-protein kinase